MKKCPKCGWWYDNEIMICGDCKCDLEDAAEGKKIPESIKLKITKAIAYIGLFVMLAGFASVIFSALTTESQYEKDYNSMQDKTWDEMTAGEQKAFQDKVEWELEEADE